MQQYASAFHFLSAAINLNPRMGDLYMLLAGTELKRHRDNSGLNYVFTNVYKVAKIVVGVFVLVYFYTFN